MLRLYTLEPAIKVVATTIEQSLRISNEIENRIVIREHLAHFAWCNSCIMDQSLRISNMSENRIEQDILEYVTAPCCFSLLTTFFHDSIE
jgi:hypothetical protein